METSRNWSTFTKPDGGTSITVLITSHNRKDKTLACLHAVYNSTFLNTGSARVILVDDGSTDGTPEAVSSAFPYVTIIHGDGNLFWNKGMHRAIERGLATECDGYLLLNDDTLLDLDAIEKLIRTWKSVLDDTGRDAIIVGSTCDAATRRTTYGGLIRPSKWKQTTFKIVEPGDEPKLCETMNCNCVLVPSAVMKTLGNFDPRYAHSMGDFDYGLRATRSGFQLWIVPGHIGICGRNSPVGTFNDTTLPLGVRWKKMMQPKGLPPLSWFIFTRQYTGIFWPLFWVWPYFRLVSSSLFTVRKSL